jgi:hypothetical protein
MSDLYLIHNGFSGNTACWWGRNSAGYTTDLGKAQVYSREEAEALCRDRPNEDIPVSAKKAEEICQKSVHIDDLRAAHTPNGEVDK